MEKEKAVKAYLIMKGIYHMQDELAKIHFLLNEKDKFRLSTLDGRWEMLLPVESLKEILEERDKMIREEIELFEKNLEKE